MFVGVFYYINIMCSLIGALRYGYYHDLPQADLPYVKIPLHTLIKLTPKAYGCDEERCGDMCIHGNHTHFS